jgi:hypothetical protein
MEAVPVGASVRALISAEAQGDLEASVGVNEARLEGRVLESNGERLLLSVKTGVGAREFGSQTLYQRIDVGRQDVLRLDVRELDLHATGGLVALIAGGITFATLEIMRGGEPGNPEPPNNDPPERRQRYWLTLPVIRW